MTSRPLHYSTLVEVANRIASGELTSNDVTATLLARIEALEPKLHAYYSVASERALEKAAEADARRVRGESLGPLDGVPIAVKDLCHVEGLVTTAGHSFRRESVAESDATVVARLEAAGAVLLGKIATTEGAMVGYHRDFEVPRNPWGENRWPGVSSGGSGVATAAGLCFGSLGTDTGGSIRYPSAVCGLVGLKPTWGRVSRHGVLDLAPTLDHVGPMTRSVRDAARMIGVIAGRDENDPTSLSSPVPDYEAELDRGATGLRVGYDERYVALASEEMAAAVAAAVEVLAGQGAEIVEVDVPEIPEDELGQWTTIASAESAAVHAETFPSRRTEYGSYFAEFLEQGNAVTGPQLAAANLARRRASGRVEPVFEGIDLLACPSVGAESFVYEPEQAYGGFDPQTGTLAGVPLDWFSRSGPFVTLWDFNGYPTLSLPCGFSSAAQPLSLQLVGRPLSESTLLRAGHAYEQATDWHRRHPELG